MRWLDGADSIELFAYLALSRQATIMVG